MRINSYLLNNPVSFDLNVRCTGHNVDCFRVFPWNIQAIEYGHFQNTYILIRASAKMSLPLILGGMKAEL